MGKFANMKQYHRHLLVIASSFSPLVKSLDSKNCIQIDDWVGANYQGTIDTTETNRKCINWKKASKITKNVDEYRKIMAALKDLDGSSYTNHNHCRNPTGLDQSPWCYTEEYTTTEGKSRNWDYCAIQTCER